MRTNMLIGSSILSIACAMAVPAAAKDEVQKDARINPDSFIQNYWEPKINLGKGIKRVVREMNMLPSKNL